MARGAAAIVLALAALPVGGAGAAAVDPFADGAASVVCPAAPAGWFNPSDAGGRFVLTPLSSAGDALYGGNDVEVDCGYFTTAGRHVTVGVRYALPRDPNPFSDFDIGCTLNDLAAGVPTGAYAWNTKDRVFRVVSEERWSYATFVDYLGQLAAPEVGGFEAIARSLLRSSEANAHACAASFGRPVALRTTWLFGFDATGTAAGVTRASGNGTFVVRADPEGGKGTIVGYQASPIVVTVRPGDSGRARSVTFRVVAPRSVRASYGATFRAAVAVTASTFAPCRTGAKGTLTVSTANHLVQLDACGRQLLADDGRITLRTV